MVFESLRRIIKNALVYCLKCIGLFPNSDPPRIDRSKVIMMENVTDFEGKPKCCCHAPECETEDARLDSLTTNPTDFEPAFQPVTDFVIQPPDEPVIDFVIGSGDGTNADPTPEPIADPVIVPFNDPSDVPLVQPSMGRVTDPVEEQTDQQTEGNPVETPVQVPEDDPVIPAVNDLKEEDEDDDLETIESKTRFFKAYFDGQMFGRFSGTTPKQVAMKGYTVLRNKGNEEDELVFSIQESTKGGNGRRYTYSGSRVAIDPPEVVHINRGTENEKTITYAYRNVVKRI
jgi:hypothetical protein